MQYLPHLDEPNVLESLSQRYEDDHIYTYTGPTLLALNPWQDLPGGNSAQTQHAQAYVCVLARAHAHTHTH